METWFGGLHGSLATTSRVARHPDPFPEVDIDALPGAHCDENDHPLPPTTGLRTAAGPTPWGIPASIRPSGCPRRRRMRDCWR